MLSNYVFSLIHRVQASRIYQVMQRGKTLTLAQQQALRTNHGTLQQQHQLVMQYQQQMHLKQ